MAPWEFSFLPVLMTSFRVTSLEPKKLKSASLPVAPHLFLLLSSFAASQTPGLELGEALGLCLPLCRFRATLVVELRVVIPQISLGLSLRFLIPHLEIELWEVLPEDWGSLSGGGPVT